MKLSIVIPCKNEAQTLPLILEQALSIDLPGIERQIIVVDDGSTDESLAVARRWQARRPGEIDVVALPTNLGKGGALRAGFEKVTGDVVLIQDADVEYSPADYPNLIAPFADPKVEVVYGSRILGGSNRSYNRYYWGGRLVTLVANILYGARLTDEPTGYKLFRKSLLDQLALESNGFEFCAEVTARVLKRGVAIVEVPISYRPRSFEEGKKIRWRDGLIAVATLLRLRFS